MFLSPPEVHFRDEQADMQLVKMGGRGEARVPLAWRGKAVWLCTIRPGLIAGLAGGNSKCIAALLS